MSTKSLKLILRFASAAFAIFGAFLLIYVGRVIWGVSDDKFSGIHPFIAFYGGYLIYLAIVFRRRFSSRFVHEFLSAIMCPIGFVACAGIVNGGFGTALVRAIIAIFAFIFIGVIYKVLLSYLGKTLFGKEIVE
jgi:hypothetical protein